MDGFRRMGMVQRDDPAVCHGTEGGVFMTGGMADHIPVSALPRLKVIQRRAEENRVRFRTVNPAKTSQTCPVPICSHTQRENRVGKVFQCLRCGYSDDADYVGSLNILTRFLTGQYGAGFKAFHEFLSGK